MVHGWRHRPNLIKEPSQPGDQPDFGKKVNCIAGKSARASPPSGQKPGNYTAGTALANSLRRPCADRHKHHSSTESLSADPAKNLVPKPGLFRVSRFKCPAPACPPRGFPVFPPPNHLWPKRGQFAAILSLLDNRKKRDAGGGSAD